MGNGFLNSECSTRYPRYSTYHDSKNSGAMSYLMHSRSKKILYFLDKVPTFMWMLILALHKALFCLEGLCMAKLMELQLSSHSCPWSASAILGGTIEVPTLSGKMQLQIPNRVEHGQLSVLRGKGLHKSGFLCFGGNVTERQRAILEEFEEAMIDENNTSAEGSCCGRIGLSVQLSQSSYLSCQY
ncbi:hypothetical protein OROHE_001075 [Orobanche hederae]